MKTHKHLALVAFGLALSSYISGSALAQPATPMVLTVPAGDPPLSQNDLRTLVGPIALYPDDLVGIILPASTYPLQIVQAARFLERSATESGLSPDPDWDNAVVALLNYPEVLRLMDENLDWTWALGESVLSQQTDVIDAIQNFRQDAYLAGNLRSDEHQFVTEDDGAIEIKPADPQVIYIPYYEPARVVVVQPRPVYFYYADPYPLYYYPYPIGYHFTSGFFWGVTSVFGIGWHTHYVNVYHHRHIGHPYYNSTYYAPYYARRGVNININVNNVTNIWQPTERRAGRPQYRNDHDRVVYSRERYTENLQRSTERRRETGTIGVAPTTRSGSRDLATAAPTTRAPQGRIATAPSDQSLQRSPRAVPGRSRAVQGEVGRTRETSGAGNELAARERTNRAAIPPAARETRTTRPDVQATQRGSVSAAPQNRTSQPTFAPYGGRTNAGHSGGNATAERRAPPAQAPAVAQSSRGAAPRVEAQGREARTPTFAPSRSTRNASPQPRGDGRSERTRAQR